MIGNMKKPSFLSIGLTVILLIIALVVLGDILNLLKANNIFGIYWPIILVMIGVLTIGSLGIGKGFSFGMIALGIILTLRNLNVFSSQAGEVIFVVLICLMALAVLVMSTDKKPPADKA